MQVIKLEHACLDIRENGKRLIVDPGGWTEPLADNSGVVAMVITHVHADHFDESKILKITQENPTVSIFCTEQVANKLGEGYNFTVPAVGQQYQAGPFSLEFFGGQHARILDDWPQDQNFGVLVNDTVYYPGDSLTPCPKPHQVLAAPASAPWLKTSEAVAFMQQDSATVVFPTHNNILNENGIQLVNRLLGSTAEATGKTFRYLTPGESLEL